MSLYRKEHHERAREHLESGDNTRLSYAALELRLLLEDIAYRKLRWYSKRLPASIKRRWQPPQAIKALVQIEPGADRDFTLDISGPPEAEGAEEWHLLGTHKTIEAGRLKKLYHKLGSFLHLPAPFGEPTARNADRTEMVRKGLEDIVSELEPVLESTLESDFAPLQVEFKCSVCATEVVCNAKGLDRTRQAVCLNPECNAEYDVLRDDGEKWSFRLRTATLACSDCGHKMVQPAHIVEEGFAVGCDECAAELVVALTILPIPPEKTIGPGQNDGGRQHSRT